MGNLLLSMSIATILIIMTQLGHWSICPGLEKVNAIMHWFSNLALFGYVLRTSRVTLCSNFLISNTWQRSTRNGSYIWNLLSHKTKIKVNGDARDGLGRNDRLRTGLLLTRVRLKFKGWKKTKSLLWPLNLIFSVIQDRQNCDRTSGDFKPVFKTILLIALHKLYNFRNVVLTC